MGEDAQESRPVENAPGSEPRRQGRGGHGPEEIAVKDRRGGGAGVAVFKMPMRSAASRSAVPYGVTSPRARHAAARAAAAWDAPPRGPTWGDAAASSPTATASSSSQSRAGGNCPGVTGCSGSTAVNVRSPSTFTGRQESVACTAASCFASGTSS